MTDTGSVEWSDPAHVDRYLARRALMGRRAEGEAVLDGLVPPDVGRVLDLGTGDGHLIRVLRAGRPEASFVGIEISPAMLAAGRAAFLDDARVVFVEHDLSEPLLADGPFDAVVSSFAIHHLEDDRKRSLNGEVMDLLAPGGVFLNLEHVSSPTPALHAAYNAEIGFTAEEEDASNRCVDVHTQLEWLLAAGFTDVDCLWKWREMALMAATRPADRP